MIKFLRNPLRWLAELTVTTSWGDEPTAVETKVGAR